MLDFRRIAEGLRRRSNLAMHFLLGVMTAQQRAQHAHLSPKQGQHEKSSERPSHRHRNYLREVCYPPWLPDSFHRQPVKLLKNTSHSERSEAESKNLPEQSRNSLGGTRMIPLVILQRRSCASSGSSGAFRRVRALLAAPDRVERDAPVCRYRPRRACSMVSCLSLIGVGKPMGRMVYCRSVSGRAVGGAVPRTIARTLRITRW